jgi:hypothetical protein
MRLHRIRHIDDGDRASPLAERDPQPVTRAIRRHVVRTVADEQSPDDAVSDHDELPPRIVGDVDVAAVRRAGWDVGRSEAAQHSAHLQRRRVDQRHGAGPDADHGGDASADGDVLRVVRHPQALDDSAARQLDRDELVGFLGGDERDRSATARLGL